MINGSVLQEDITILILCVLSNRTNCRRQKLIELQRDEFTIIVGDFYIPSSEMTDSATKKVTNISHKHRFSTTTKNSPTKYWQMKFNNI